MRNVQLNALCKINMGQSPESSSYNTEKIGLPFYQGNADFGNMYPRTRIWCSNPKKIAEKDDVLLSVRAPIGAVNITQERCCIGRGVCALTPIEGVCNPHYLYYLIKSKNDTLNRLGTGSTFKAVGRKTIEQLSVPDYSWLEQQNICQNLQKLDDIIECRNKEVRLLNELVQSRFVELFGDPVINSNQYKVDKLGHYIKFLTSGSRGWVKYCNPEGKYWFITIKNVRNGHIRLDNMENINPPDNAEAKRTKVQAGDLLISITADLGRTGVVTEDIAKHGAFINQHLTCIRLNQEYLVPMYVAYYLESEAGVRQFYQNNQNAVKAGINFSSINSLAILLPPVALQNQFVNFIQQLDKSKLAVQKSLDELEILKKSLMQQYFG